MAHCTSTGDARTRCKAMLRDAMTEAQERGDWQVYQRAAVRVLKLHFADTRYTGETHNGS